MRADPTQTSPNSVFRIAARPVTTSSDLQGLQPRVLLEIEQIERVAGTGQIPVAPGGLVGAHTAEGDQASLRTGRKVSGLLYIYDAGGDNWNFEFRPDE